MKTFKFPAGEVHVQLDFDEQDSLLNSVFIDNDAVWCKLRSSDDIMQMLLIGDILDGVGHKKSDLFIPYVPYGRQDRRTSRGEPVSIRVMANLINSMGFKRVHILDAHSDVTPALINGVKEHSIMDTQLLHYLSNDYNYLVCPDAGARKRVQKASSVLQREIIYFDKQRDTETGKLSGFVCHDEVKPESYLIFDDLTDGGYTHIKIAQMLKDRGAARVGLCVSHAIMSKGVDVFKEYIDEIITTNSYCTEFNTTYVKVIQCESFMMI